MTRRRRRPGRNGRSDGRGAGAGTDGGGGDEVSGRAASCDPADSAGRKSDGGGDGNGSREEPVVHVARLVRERRDQHFGGCPGGITAGSGGSM